ncbi:hypothetical protein PENTCL1PPCAC_16807 [Pristionchus entomophagus]|uniref:Uncharacterized protein n=1 Tax=Pristionchus entomophagus TaxID=358040 RepID=A0AAV5TJP5_9BILA|nr:hypothetical protein PENTCL1PPCAC_16807 [Pristionchus entomophagus]
MSRNTRSPRAGTSPSTTTPSSRQASPMFSMECSARSAKISSMTWRISARRRPWTTSSLRLWICAVECRTITSRRTASTT